MIIFVLIIGKISFFYTINTNGDALILKESGYVDGAFALGCTVGKGLRR